MRHFPLYHLTLARVRELLREPEAIFWVFAAPVLLAMALGLAFRSSGPPELNIGVQDAPGAAWIIEALRDEPQIVALMLDADQARDRLRTGKVALVVIPGEELTYWFDPTRPDSRYARLAVDDALQRAAGRTDPQRTGSREMNEKGSRYIDFLIPGLLGMNLMGTGMWGIGFSIVMSRSKQLLKRMVASPMRKTDYLAAQMLGRLVFLVLEVGAIVIFAVLVFGVPLRGSLPAFAAVCVLGAMTFAGLGLLVASRARTVEGVSGLMNIVMLPMWICSGIFFSTSRFPEVMQPAVQALPLTAVNDALRAIMLDGATLASQSAELAVIVFWMTASFVAALVLFRWT
ncbi:MAG: ABC transporter permease [Acidobacteriota bacterium]|nr:ABC transporter permease [Acidobacteriota bacterium]